MTPRPIAPKTWDAIWTDYLQGTVLHRVTFAALAAAHGVSAKTIGRHARIHHWDAKRRAAQVRDMLQLVEPDYQRSLRAFRSAVTRLMPLLRGEDFPAIHRVAWVDSAPWPAAWPAFGRKRRGPGRDPLCWLPRSSGPVRAKRITLGHLNVPDPTGMNKLVSAEVFGGLPAQLRPC